MTKDEALNQLREIHAIQGRDGCWDIDDYMLGMFNGLELALSIAENRECRYKQRPKSQPKQEPVKDWIASHNEICALLRQAHDALALTSYPPQPKQEPVGYVSEGEPDRLIAQKQTKTPLRNYRLFTHDVPLYTTPHTKVGCVECRVSGGHAFYCVACAKNLFGGYKK